jgi:hypothetical protein
VTYSPARARFSQRQLAPSHVRACPERLRISLVGEVRDRVIKMQHRSDWRSLLFVRHKPDDGRGFTSPYLFLGRVRYVSHESEKPMGITWKLDAEMPLDFFFEVKIAAG